MFLNLFNSSKRDQNIQNERSKIYNEISIINKQLHDIYNPSPKIKPWRYRLNAVPTDYEEFTIRYLENLKMNEVLHNKPEYKEYGLMNDSKMNFEELDNKLQLDTDNKYKLFEIINEHQLDDFETQMWAESAIKDIHVIKISEQEKDECRHKYGLAKIDDKQLETIKQLNSEKENLEKQLNLLRKL